MKMKKAGEIGKIFMDYPNHGSINRTMSQLYQTHKRLGMEETFKLNRKFYRRLL